MKNPMALVMFPVTTYKKGLVGAVILAAVSMLFRSCGDDDARPSGAHADPGASSPSTATSKPGVERYKSGSSWWMTVVQAAGEAAGWTLEAIHDGSGWMLGKNHLSIEQSGEVRQVGSGLYVTNYVVTVSRSKENFSTKIMDLPCDEFGIIDETSQVKFNETVEKIKKMLDRTQP